MHYPHKEQAIYGRIFNNLEEVRAAVAAFVVTFNEEWRLEKLGCLQRLTLCKNTNSEPHFGWGRGMVRPKTP